MADILTRKIALDCDVDHAFALFTGKIDLWWPRGHRRSRDASLSLNPESGGRLVEHAADGSEWTMGRVTAVDPPSRINLDWFPGSAAAPTSLEIEFAAVGGGTEITVTHRALSPAAEAIWPQRVASFIKGWDAVLPALKTFIEED